MAKGKGARRSLTEAETAKIQAALLEAATALEEFYGDFGAEDPALKQLIEEAEAVLGAREAARPTLPREVYAVLDMAASGNTEADDLADHADRVRSQYEPEAA